MCLYCHRDDSAFDTNPAATYESVHLAAHGDGDAACLRYCSPPNDEENSYWWCVDCGDTWPGDPEVTPDHCCYD